MTAAPSVPNMQASGTSRFGFSTAAEFCAAEFHAEEGPQGQRDARTHALRKAQSLRIPGRRERLGLNQNQPMSESRPTGMMTPQTVTEPMRPVDARAAEVRDRRQPEQRDHADAGRDRRRREPGEERREIADRGDRDRDVADRQGQEVEKEHEEIAGFAVGVFGIGRHASRALVEEAGLRESVGDRHRAERRHDPGQQRDRADLCHVRRQHDDAGAHHVDGHDERQLDRDSSAFGCVCFRHRRSSRSSLSRPSLANHVGVKLDAAVHPFLEHALHFVVEAREAVERFLEGEEVVEHRLRPVVPSLAGHDRRRCPADRSERAWRRCGP